MIFCFNSIFPKTILFVKNQTSLNNIYGSNCIEFVIFHSGPTFLALSIYYKRFKHCWLVCKKTKFDTIFKIYRSFFSPDNEKIDNIIHVLQNEIKTC